MTDVARAAWLAVVQNGDDQVEETELVTIEFRDGQPAVIELTDGRRITLLEPAGSSPGKAAA